MTVVKPKISVLDSENIEYILQKAFEILENPGIKVESETARQILLKRVGNSAVNGEWVTIPEEIVRWSLKNVPSKVDIYDRLGNSTFSIGDGEVHCGIGVTALYYQDPLTDNLKAFNRSHIKTLVNLANKLPNYEVISTPGILQDVPVNKADMLASLEMTANSNKPLVLLISDGDQYLNTINMFESLYGVLNLKPSLIPYLNPITPLVMNKDTFNKLLISIEKGLPVIYSNYSLAGMTAPITPSGILPLLLAELLAGVVFSQLVKPGAAIVVGMLPAYFDMKHMTNFYDPMSFLINVACSEIMQYLNLPHCGTSGSGTGWGADLIAASTYWMNYLTYFLSNGGIAPFVGDSLGSKSISAKTLVYVHEVIEQSRRLSNGFDLDGTDFDLDELRIAARSGSFISTHSTKKYFRNAYYQHPFFKNLTMEKWQASGQPTAEGILRDTTIQLLKDNKDAENYNEILARGEMFINNLDTI